MVTISLVSPSMIATSPESRSVTRKKLSMLRRCIGALGRSVGATITFQLFFISGMPHSGGAGGSCWRKRASMLMSSFFN
jgi:hypothetical protein